MEQEGEKRGRRGFGTVAIRRERVIQRRFATKCIIVIIIIVIIIFRLSHHEERESIRHVIILDKEKKTNVSFSIFETTSTLRDYKLFCFSFR